MVLCWTAFMAILGRMQPTGCRLDTPAAEKSKEVGPPLKLSDKNADL